MRRMVIDTANVLFRVAAAHSKYNQQGTPEEQAGLAMHIALNTVRKYFNKFKPDQLAVTFEGGNNWRKEYTKSEKCLSKKVYKANRVKDPSMIPFFELINAFEKLVRQHTGLICLSHPKLEGDDLIAGYVQKFTSIGDEVIIVSGDKDFIQLLKHKNTILLDPDKGVPRTVESVCGVDDPNFYMFEKCFRGDKGDNVWPAYPRVFKKRLLKAYQDDYERTKIMNEVITFKDPETLEESSNTVQDLFLENDLLMNLESQPEDIKQIINEVLDYELSNHGKFSFFHFSQFCGKYGLKQIADSATNFIEMFSANGLQDTSKSKKELLVF